MSILTSNGITILDPTMRRNEIRLLPKGLEEILGIKIINETGKHIFIEVKPNLIHPMELVIRQ